MHRKRILIIAAAGIISIFVCCGVLVLASLLGITLIQHDIRDNLRRDALQEVAIELSNIYAESGIYPVSLIIDTHTITFVTPDYPTKTFVLKGVAQGDDQTTEHTSAYCYVANENTYKLGVKLENGKWYDLGTDKCTDKDKLPFAWGIE